MTTLEKIYTSQWWKQAEEYPDRHYPKDSGIMLSDHLKRVFKKIETIFNSTSSGKYHEKLYLYILDLNFNSERIREILKVVALLHDIGKPSDNKEKKMEHPIKKIEVVKKHEIVGIQVAMDILKGQEDFSETEKNTIYSLIERHDLPYAWYRQFQKNKFSPEYKTWKKLDEEICFDKETNKGIILLALFKLADIDGHGDVSDVLWFIGELNAKYLKLFGKFFPVPTKNDLN